ncbi:MAG: Holliday junction resolvase RuvX [candidate division Zixibacteria bacterium]|nr:Holliday junction resolvase RuvX [candidate division Zixibacteria bacterium]
MIQGVLIGIDFGERRIGLAKSDSTGLIASAYKTITFKSINRALDEIREDIENFKAEGVVIGYPLALTGGSAGERCQRVDEFILRLQKRYPGPIYRVDERFSSTEAAEAVHLHQKKIGRDKGKIDRIAAAIILQRFLDEQREAEHN